jgi:DsbC/DsbD-like thiol-disulfide interchange protein
MKAFADKGRFAAAAAVLTCCCSFAAAQEKPTKDVIVLASGEEASKDHVRPQVYLSVDRLPAGETVRFAVVLEIEEGWHINTNPAQPEFVKPTTVTFKGKHGSKLKEITYPKGREFTIAGMKEPQSVYEGKVVLYGDLTVPENAAQETEELTVEVKFQACNEKQCLAPKTAKLVGKIPVAAKGETVKKINEKVFAQDERKRGKQQDA